MITISEYFSGNADKTSPFIMQMHGAVAIPVGVIVEIRIFYSEGNMFGKSKPPFEFPLIMDLETGIQYGDLHQFYTISPDENLREYANLKGTVKACNITTVKLSAVKLQTTLLIEPEIEIE